MDAAPEAARIVPVTLNRFELDLSFFASPDFGETNKQRIIVIFLAVAELQERRTAGDVLLIDIYGMLKEVMTEEEFIYLYRFAKYTLRMFKNGRGVEINEKCEFVINCGSVC